MSLTQVEWVEAATAHFQIRCQPGGEAARQLAPLLARIETYDAALRGLLALPERQVPIRVELLEAAGGAQDSPTLAARGEIRAFFRPEAPGLDLERALVLVLLADLSDGAERAWPPLVVAGLRHCALQRLGDFPAETAIDETLQAALTEGRLPTVAALFAPDPPAEGIYQTAATGFWAYLFERWGGAQVAHFLREWRAGGQDRAARAAFGRNLAGLNREWRQRLQGGRAATGVGHFLRVALGYLRPYWINAGEIMLYTLVSVAFAIGLAQTQGLVLDRALLPRDGRALGIILACLIVAFLVTSLASLRENYLLARVTESIVRELRQRLFAKVQELDAGALQRYQSGDLLSRIISDVGAIDAALASAFGRGLQLILTLVLALTVIFVQSWPLGLITLTLTALFAVANRILGPRAAAASLDYQERFAKSTVILQENLGAQGVVKAFGLEPWAIDRFATALRDVFRASMSVTVLAGLYGVAATMLTTTIYLTMLGVGGWLVIAGDLTAGTLIVFMSLLLQVVMPVQGLAGIYQQVQQATGALGRVEEILTTAPRVDGMPFAPPLPTLSREITIEGLQFGYDPARTVLQAIDLRLPAGATIAFVGPSGCGKSTMLNLLLRLHDPQEGRIAFDGHDLRGVNLGSLRSQIGIVPQESQLFDLSVRENIRLGNPTATDAEIEAAARVAEAHDLISALPRGYDTPVGERGGRLSGGQRQRIAIARALVRRPSLLLLDEATSALDAQTEAAINATLARLARGRTVISVTHRLPAIVDYDLIVVFDQGRVVEQGTHGALLDRGGLYSRLWAEQASQGAGASGAPVVPPTTWDSAPWLGTLPLFAGVAPALLADAARRLTIDAYPADRLLLREGRAGLTFHLIREGEGEVFTVDRDGVERTLAVLRAGDYFGETALLYDLPRTASVRARTALTLASIGHDDFHHLLQAIPGLRERLEQTVRARQHLG